MANEHTETILLEFTVDQGAAEKQLEKIEGILLDNKKAQQELTKAYKAGNITQQEYIQENIRLQANIKKEQQQKTTLIKTINTESNSRNALRDQISKLVKEYDALNQGSTKGVLKAKELENQIAKLSTQLTKGDKAAGLFKNQIGNYPNAFGEAAKSINVAGVSVGQMGAKLASFANPATAAIGIIGALGAAYARSTVGAKDLEFASNQLTAAVTLSTNAFANLFSSAEDGEGFFTKALNSYLQYLAPSVAAVTKQQALNIESLQDLQREEISIRDDINERLSENQDLLAEISDEQTSLNRQLELSQAIRVNLLNNEAELVNVLESELAVLQNQLAFNKNNEELQTAVLLKEKEISKAKLDTSKKLKANEVLQSNINDKIREQIALEERSARISRSKNVDTTQAGIPTSTLEIPQTSADNALKATKELTDNVNKVKKDSYDKDLQNFEYTQALKAQAEQNQLAITQDIFAQGAALFGEQTAAYKTFATISTLISTYSAAQKAYEAAFLPVPTVASPALGAAYAAVAVASGLANVAQINGLQFAEGGYTGPGDKYKPAGVVHAGEVVWSQKDVAMAGGPSAANAMRPTSGLRPYSDGGFVTQQNISGTQQALITANAFKNLPAPIVSVKEVTKIQNRISAREKISRLGS